MTEKLSNRNVNKEHGRSKGICHDPERYPINDLYQWEYRFHDTTKIGILVVPLQNLHEQYMNMKAIEVLQWTHFECGTMCDPVFNTPYIFLVFLLILWHEDDSKWWIRRNLLRKEWNRSIL